MFQVSVDEVLQAQRRNPQASREELAKLLNINPTWLGYLISSDAYQMRRAQLDTHQVRDDG